MTTAEKLIDTLRRLKKPESSYVVDQTNDALSLVWIGCDGPSIEELLSDEIQSSLPLAVISWSCRDFLLRFTPEEREAIIVTGRSVAAVEDLRSMLLASPVIHSDSADLLAGMSALVALGLLTQQRHNEILGVPT